MQPKVVSAVAVFLNGLLIVAGNTMQHGRNFGNQQNLGKSWLSPNVPQQKQAQTPAQDKLFFPPYVFPFWGLPYGMYSNGGFFNPGLFPFVPGGPGFPPYDGIFGGPLGPGTFPGSGPTPFKYPPYNGQGGPGGPGGQKGDSGGGKSSGKKGGKKYKGKKYESPKGKTPAPAPEETPYKPNNSAPPPTPAYQPAAVTPAAAPAQNPSSYSPPTPQAPYKKPCSAKNKQRCGNKGGNMPPSNYPAPAPTTTYSQTNNYASSYPQPTPNYAVQPQQVNIEYNSMGAPQQPSSYYNSPPLATTYNNPPPPAIYNNPSPPSSYNNPPPPSPTYNNPSPPSSYNNPSPPSPTYNNPSPPSPTYNNPSPPSPAYNNLSPPPSPYDNSSPLSALYNIGPQLTGDYNNNPLSYSNYPAENFYEMSIPTPSPRMVVSMTAGQQGSPISAPYYTTDNTSPSSPPSSYSISFDSYSPALQNPPEEYSSQYNAGSHYYGNTFPGYQSSENAGSIYTPGAGDSYQQSPNLNAAPTSPVPTYQPPNPSSIFQTNFSSSSNNPIPGHDGNPRQFAVEHNFDIGQDYQTHNFSITSVPEKTDSPGGRISPVYIPAPSSTAKTSDSLSHNAPPKNVENYGPADPNDYFTSVVTKNTTGLYYTKSRR